MTEYNVGDAAAEASEIVSTKRDSHGDAYENHKHIAALWSAFLGEKLQTDIQPWEAAIMMQHVKQSRMKQGQLIKDHFVDVAGYSDVALDAAVRDPNTDVSTDD